jgi:hypothetical protein
MSKREKDVIVIGIMENEDGIGLWRGRHMAQLSSEAREARIRYRRQYEREYKRKWRQKPENKEKQKEYERRYWERKAKQMTKEQ